MKPRTIFTTTKDDKILELMLHLGVSASAASIDGLISPSYEISRSKAQYWERSMRGKLAHEGELWSVKPICLQPGRMVRRVRHLRELSLFASAYYYLYLEEVYETCEATRILHAYDLYTNVREHANTGETPVSPSTAIYMAMEFVSHAAVIPYCPKCEVRYYSAISQYVGIGCPLCRRPGQGDLDKPYLGNIVRKQTASNSCTQQH